MPMIAATDQSDMYMLTQLSTEYLVSDQNSDARRYQETLSDDFTASLPDFEPYDKRRFL